MNDELIKFFKGKGMKRIVEGIKKKYYSFGEIKGSIKLEALNDIERETLKKLGLKSESDSISISMKKLMGALGMEDTRGLEELIRHGLKIELRTKEEDLEDERLKVLKKTNLLLEGIKNNKLREYIMQTPSLLKLKQARELLVLFDSLVEGGKNIITLGNLGGRSVYDPHFLDVGTPNYRHLINYLKYYYGVDVSTLLEEKELLLRMGIVGDSLSNFISVYGFKGKTKDDKDYGLMDTDESLNINIENLYKVEEIESRSKKILIVENPNVFIALKDEIKIRGIDISLICTSGQVNQSGYVFLDKLKKVGVNLYYSGDIDPEGILIGQGLKEKYPRV